MEQRERINRKFLFIDEVTQKNLRSIRKLRVEKKLSVRQLSEQIGIKQHCLYDYENGRCYPTIGNYMRLAAFFGWQIEDNPNYIFYHEFFSKDTRQRLKRERERHYLSVREIAREANISFASIRHVFSLNEQSSALGFASVQKVLSDEERRAKVRKELEPRRKYYRRRKEQKS